MGQGRKGEARPREGFLEKAEGRCQEAFGVENPSCRTLGDEEEDGPRLGRHHGAWEGTGSQDGQAPGRVRQQQPFPVMWKPSFKPGWMEKCWGLAARPEQPDVCGEQSVEDGVRGRKGDWRSHPAHLSAPRHTVPFPPNPLASTLLLPGKVGPTTCPSSPLDNTPRSFSLGPTTIPLVASGGLARRGVGGRLQATAPPPRHSPSGFPWPGERQGGGEQRAGLGEDRVRAKTLAHRTRHAGNPRIRGGNGPGWQEQRMKGRLCGQLGRPHPLLTYLSAGDLSRPSDPISLRCSSVVPLHPAP